MKNKPKRILVIRLSAMGDVAITVPAIRSMCEQYPNTEIYVLSNQAFAPFFSTINKVHFLGVKLSNYKGIKGLYRLYKELKVYNFDLIADLHNVIRSKILRTLFFLSGVKVKTINKGRKEKRALTRQKNKILKQLETSAERYADVFRMSGFPLILKFTSIYSKKNIELDNSVKNILHDCYTKPKVGIAPFAKHKGKIYPTELMEEVIKALNNKKVKMFLFGGGADEKKIIDQWVLKYPFCFSVIGVLNLTTELQLISQLSVMLSMDSGNMHLASLVNTPVISVWGATHPFAGFYGWNQKPENIVQIENLDCRPCSVYGNKPCFRKDYACLTKTKPSAIIEKLNYYIENTN